MDRHNTLTTQIIQNSLSARPCFAGMHAVPHPARAHLAQHFSYTNMYHYKNYIRFFCFSSSTRARVHLRNLQDALRMRCPMSVPRTSVQVSVAARSRTKTNRPVIQNELIGRRPLLWSTFTGNPAPTMTRRRLDHHFVDRRITPNDPTTTGRR